MWHEVILRWLINSNWFVIKTSATWPSALGIGKELNFKAGPNQRIERRKKNMADEEERPFKAEYAKSSRAACKQCKGSITKDTLRLAKMVQVAKISKLPDDYIFLWVEP